ncbi:hypothetical protein LCGC14_2201620 [marine sediment metagenome]|uniref:Uncharacterized protein n=1 Tax=marine sediment metagenome TaxID=412755 RepID=A0A0F9DGQ8_9ZZZZ
MIPKEVSGKILEDAREKIASVLLQVFNDGFVLGEIGMGGDSETVDAALDQILAISGTTDIECPDEATGDPDFATKTRYKWKVSVVLENGELPENNYTVPDLRLGYQFAQRDMGTSGWVKEVRQVVE